MQLWPFPRRWSCAIPSRRGKSTTASCFFRLTHQLSVAFRVLAKHSSPGDFQTWLAGKSLMTGGSNGKSSINQGFSSSVWLQLPSFTVFWLVGMFLKYSQPKYIVPQARHSVKPRQARIQLSARVCLMIGWREDAKEILAVQNHTVHNVFPWAKPKESNESSLA